MRELLTEAARRYQEWSDLTGEFTDLEDERDTYRGIAKRLVMWLNGLDTLREEAGAR